MRIEVTAAELAEFDAYKELDLRVLVFGCRTRFGKPFSHLIIQIEEPSSFLAGEGAGMHVEMDETSEYGAVRAFAYSPSLNLLRVEFNPNLINGISELSLRLPTEFSQSGRSVLEQMERAFSLLGSHPYRGDP